MDTVTGKKSTISDEDVQNLIGGFGKYQLLLPLLIFPCKISTALHSLGIVFLAPSIKYECLDEIYNNITISPNHCPCNNPKYDLSLFQETMITKWDLICDHGWLVSFSQTVIMLGILTGSIITGALSDRFGRKKSLIGANMLEIVAGIAASLTPNFLSFLLLRFLIGCSVGAIFIVSFVYAMEFTGKQYRELMSCLLQFSFNAGYILLPIFGYFMTSWIALNLSYALPAVLMIFLYCLFPETPRWLITNGRKKEATLVLTKIAKLNNKPTENISYTVNAYQNANIGENVKKGTIIDLFKTPTMRKHMICIVVNWIVCSLGFFGVSQYIGQLSGNIFINVSISAALNCVATPVSFVSVKFMKRRNAMITMNIITSLCLFSIAVIPESLGILKVIFACTGNCCAFASFVIIYLYTSEIFPTVVRSAAMGVASMFSRFGAMIAPFVVASNTVGLWLPPVIFGSGPLIAAILCIFLPETKNRDLQNTLREEENIKK